MTSRRNKIVILKPSTYVPKQFVNKILTTLNMTKQTAESDLLIHELEQIPPGIERELNFCNRIEPNTKKLLFTEYVLHFANYYRVTNRNDYNRSYLGFLLVHIASVKIPCQSKIRHFSYHSFSKENISGSQISMYPLKYKIHLKTRYVLKGSRGIFM